jgi:hypothetical protein
MIFKQIFHKNIIGKSLDVAFLVEVFFSFSVDYSIFQKVQECYSTRMEKLKQTKFYERDYFNFLLTN